MPTSPNDSLSRSAFRAITEVNDGSPVSDVAERFGNAMPVIRRSARDLEDTIRDNPGRAAAAVGLAALALAAAAFVLSSRR